MNAITRNRDDRWYIYLIVHETLVMKKVYLSVFAAIISVIVFAQESGGNGDGAKLDVNINTNDSAWYASPWVWVVGAAVFILLLVALTRGGSRRAD